MAFAPKALTAIAALTLLSLGACATDGAYGAGDVKAGLYPAPPAPNFGDPAQGYPAPPVYRGVAAAPALTPFAAHDGLLSSPPNNAKPGDCYAKVVVPGQPIAPPPPQPRAVWVQTPPGPGQISPTWCIYYEQGAAPPPVAYTPERYGWIRVVCDKDATEDKIRHVQRRLHAWGDYDGAYDGHFNPMTAKGVARFQEQRHLDHGGYLSVKTVEALEDAPPPPPVDGARVYAAAGSAPSIYAPPIDQQPPAYPSTYQPAPAPSPLYGSSCGQPACGQVPAPQATYAPAPVYAPPTVIYQRVITPVVTPVIIPMIRPQIVQPYAPQYGQGCGSPQCQPAPYPCAACGMPGGYGQGYGYGQNGTPPYRALLTWPGKSVY